MINCVHGINLKLNNVRLCLDGDSSAELAFISHAHTDHLIKKPLSHPVIASKLTKELCYERVGVRLQENLIFNDYKGLRLEMIDNGHIAGSKALLINGSKRVLYTSDFSLHDRYFIKGFKPPKCDVLIIESTYGSQQYKFHNPEEVMKEALSDINDYLSNGRSIVLMGYALGKAQLISKLVEGYDNVFVYKSIKNINELVLKHGYPVPSHPELNIKELPSQFIAVTPQYGPGNPLIKRLRAKGAVVLAFTGWTGHRGLGVDKAYELSDHADFTDLIKTVKSCSPEKVYTHHGYAEEFAELLRFEDYDAEAVNNINHKISVDNNDNH